MGQYIKVKVHAGEKKNRFEQLAPDRFEIWVKAPAQEGRANQAVREVLAQALGVTPEQLSLVKGVTSPSKLFLKRG